MCSQQPRAAVGLSRTVSTGRCAGPSTSSDRAGCACARHARIGRGSPIRPRFWCHRSRTKCSWPPMTPWRRPLWQLQRRWMLEPWSPRWDHDAPRRSIALLPPRGIWQREPRWPLRRRVERAVDPPPLYRLSPRRRDAPLPRVSRIHAVQPTRCRCRSRRAGSGPVLRRWSGE